MYLSMSRPAQLTRAQVDAIKEINDGSPVRRELITVDRTGVFSTRLDIRENDVFLVKLIRS